MIDTLITSKTRIKLLLRLFLNSNTKAYLRELASDFNESTNSIRMELNRFEEAGLITSSLTANKKLYQANTKHPLFVDIQSLLMKHTGLSQIIEKVIFKLGDLDKVFVIGDFAKGIDNKIINLLMVGDSIDEEYLKRLIKKVETTIFRTIDYQVMQKKVAEEHLQNDFDQQRYLLLWQAE